MKKLHNLEGHIEVMDEDEAEDTFHTYNNVWAPQNSSYSPEKKTETESPHNEDSSEMSAFRQCLVTPEKLAEQSVSKSLFTNKNIKMYKCKQCPYENEVRSKVLAHLAIHPKNKCFSCMKCGKLTNHRTSIHRHIRIIHHSADFSNLVESLIFTQDEAHMGTYRCAVCGQTSIYKSSLKKHVRDVHHSIDTNELIECIKPGIDTYVRHRKSKIPIMTINKVGGKSKLTYKLKRAIKPKIQMLKSVKHKGRTMYKCNICPELSRSAFHANVHKTRHIPGPAKTYKCKVCPLYVNNAVLLRKHTKWHAPEATGDSEEALSDTEVTFNHKVSQQRTGLPRNDVDDKIAGVNISQKIIPDHVKVKTELGTRYNCLLCPSSSCHSLNYWKHMVNHKRRPNADYKCSKCDYWVLTAHGRIQHMRVHSQEYFKKYHSQKVVPFKKETKKVKATEHQFHVTMPSEKKSTAEKVETKLLSEKSERKPKNEKKIVVGQ